MSNQISDQFPTDKARKIVAAMRASMRRDAHAYPEAKFLADLSGYIKDLEALLRPRPTLAEMSIEGRESCRWMRADVAGTSKRYMIADPRDEDNDAAILFSEEGQPEWVFPEYVTPRPDLPRLTWTDTVQPAPALPEGWRTAEHRWYGPVIVTNSPPYQGGNVYVVIPDDGDRRGYRWSYCPPTDLTYTDEEEA